VNAPFDELTRIVREAPGPAAVRGTLRLLTGLAEDENHDAALALGRIVCEDLGLSDGRPRWPDAAPESVRAAGLPPLIELLVLGYAPRAFLADPVYAQRLADSAGLPELYGRFRDLVRRGAPAQDLTLAAFVLAVFATFVGSMGEYMSGSLRQRVLRQIVRGSRIVPGDSVDSTFSVGRDFVLGAASFDGFSFTIGHELGHHLSDHLTSGQEDRLDAKQVHALADAVRRVLAEADRLRGQPMRPGDPRMARLPSGLTLVCTVESSPDGVYTHFSLSQAGGPVSYEHAVAYTYVLADVLGVPPDVVGVAYSPAGMCHLGLLGVPRPPRWRLLRGPNPADLKERASAWFAELSAADRVGRDEQDLGHILGMWERPAYVYATAEDAMEQLRLCARLREGAQPEEDGRARLRAAVACGDPVALRLVLADQPNRSEAGDVGLARLGQSRCLLVTDVVTHAGSSSADLREVLTELHQAGYDVNEPVTDGGGTLLSDAAVRDAELAAFLLATGADVHRRDRDGATALARAAWSANWRSVTVLLDAGARPDDRDGEGRTALHHAVASGSAETVSRIVAGGAAVDAADARGAAPLAYATDPAVVSVLCRAGADPNAADSTGRTALMTAAGLGDVEVVGELLRYGADPDEVTDAGEAALHFAAFAGKPREAVLAALLDAGADIEEETNEGMTALMAAAMNAHDETVAFLLERGADPNARTVRGHTALMHASDGRTEWTRDPSHNDRMQECMRLLVAAGAEIDATDIRGWTALHYACLGFDAGPVERLLKLGADPNVTTEDGTTPLGQARARGHEKMTEDLIRAGARDEPS
ncbi:ankyrin repeat domain-containing protein, partial [Nonomuraea sp. RK-328]|nr:ankyrin repeat domain-containing protein [Nonomuraea sp. RK-328]